ncbi:chemotaxis protein CheB [Thiocystis violacea]|uniref:chemotaxis protein CheB n=1 Tax=Thiocystis violacea TaxID=13725 RepID=UPI0019070A15|nr:chemotaxis protein CheB [Thiocystis violacea]MBK1716989.1 chemotaxis protein CheR [Thiocystis violacea]
MTRKKTPHEDPAHPAPVAEPPDAPPLALESDPVVAVDLETTPEPEPDPPPEPGFPVVGIGASAGGLAAFEAFFSAIPAGIETGMAFVLVQHLAPNHKSLLTELVKRYTRMSVQEVEDGMAVRPDCAYIIPPSHDMALFNGRLKLLEPSSPRGLRLPIDFFFRSLAQDQHERAIGVILSGTGSDGTLGARAIKGEGGLILVQSPESAAYDGMPRSAIATGLTDFVLSPEAMPTRLMTYVAHAFGKGPRALVVSTKTEEALTKICLLLRDRTGRDFHQYKQSTLVRRIERRMALHRIPHQSDYVRYLRQDPAEIEALYRDLLIGVTSFFRDPEAFDALRTEVIPRLFADKPAGASVRIWVCGCSTGEEAYSIAILLQEHLEFLKQTFKVQVFATDIDDRAIEQARAGVYPPSIAADVSPERLARFFSQDPETGVYRIQKVVRDLIVFSQQDLIRDPPFSRLDLISCRNLLIYFNGDLQQRLMPLFHYALNPDGVLFLGNSESIGEALRLFSSLNRKWKLYARQTSMTNAKVPVLGTLRAPHPDGGIPAPAPSERRKGGIDLRVLTEQVLLRHFDPSAVLVNGRGEILNIHGHTGRYLELAPGEIATNILGMAREGLRRALTAALHRAVARKEVVHLPRLRVKTNGDFSGVDLTVHPIQSVNDGGVLSDLYLVVLEAIAMLEPESTAEATDPLDTTHERRIAELELELRTKEDYLQTTLEEMETANEELKSTNEEMQSVNEELQSSNEELETAKEELQSVNEELATVNAELQTKVVDLSRVNNDMNNLLAGTGVATLFVDHQLRITRFTPTATQLIKLIPTDIGRPVGDIVSNILNYESFVEDVWAVLADLVSREKEVQTRQGAWYMMRIGPYRTLDNVIEGAVITFMDISTGKRDQEALGEARVLAEGIVDTVREPLLVLDSTLRLISANRSFYREFQVTPAQSEGQLLYELGDGQWDIPALRERLLEIQSQGSSFEDYEVTHDFPRIGPRTMRLNARRLEAASGKAGRILLAIEDVTEWLSRVGLEAASEPSAPESVDEPTR